MRQSASTWREGNELAYITRSRVEMKAPVGTMFSFSLNEQAHVAFIFGQEITGRRVGHKCLAKTHKNARYKVCTRMVTAGTLSFIGHSGTNRVVFQGRISRSTKLKPGRYTVAITATNAAGQTSMPQKLSFTIVK
jgi:hypothetical protein